MGNTGFLYYVPEIMPTAKVGELAELGLDYAFETQPQGRKCDPSGSPDGAGGSVFVEPGAVELGKIGCFPHLQSWKQIAGGAGWVGYYPDSMPNPAILQRKKILQGNPVQIGESQTEWIVPIIRGLSADPDDAERLEYSVRLPCRSTRNAAGEWTRGEILNKYRHLWDIALAWSSTVEAARMEVEEKGPDGKRRTVAQLDFDHANDALVAVLSANYRVGPTETEILGLHDDKSIFDVLNAAIDFPAYVDWMKKKMTVLS